jgi:hypothetical protein
MSRSKTDELSRCTHGVPRDLYCDHCHGPLVGPFSRVLALRQMEAGFRPPAPPSVEAGHSTR